MDPKVPDSEFGNLSFEEYSFPTDVEKELTRLQALIKTQGLSGRSYHHLKRASSKTLDTSLSQCLRQTLEYV